MERCYAVVENGARDRNDIENTSRGGKVYRMLGTKAFDSANRHPDNGISSEKNVKRDLIPW